MILTPNPSRRVFGYPAPVDLRNGYNGLFGLVEQGLHRDPMCGDLYLFVNEARKLCKILVWDGSGLCIFQNQLASHCTSCRSRRAL
jgi:transposase